MVPRKALRPTVLDRPRSQRQALPSDQQSAIALRSSRLYRATLPPAWHCLLPASPLFFSVFSRFSETAPVSRARSRAKDGNQRVSGSHSHHLRSRHRRDLVALGRYAAPQHTRFVPLRAAFPSRTSRVFRASPSYCAPVSINCPGINELLLIVFTGFRGGEKRSWGCVAAARSKGHVISAIWTKKMTILVRPWTLELQLKTLILNFGRILVQSL